ncbi:serine/threonine protein kinase [Rhizobium leguminosarum]|uniref:serine/threonine-protein kinase n=1 Tax=Rhizobium leguminosarum TaxID=384 RepID=UPI001C970878|nr:serine/threonine-protein kinase [Rhizobium leguminosarum]MBY5337333.1 serine/threonine protein kinase [Rhizobium leguminosarum]
MNQLVPVLLVPNMQLYKYQLINRIGQGSFGEVWSAIDLALQREFAVKFLKPGVSVDERLREGQIGNLLSHNNLVRVHQADVVNVGGADVVALAMDYLPDGSVETLANPAGYVPLPLVLRIARDILQGLDYLHARNFYHNDIKPGNILLGPQQQAMLSDYGITGVSSDGNPVAAPNSYLLHCAPEVRATGNVGVSSDIFQAGMTLARMLLGLNHLSAIWASVGRSQYENDMDAGKLLSQKDFPNHIPAAVRRVILTAVHPDPAQRYSSSLEMRRAIEKLNFPGYWSVDASGREFGVDHAHRYTFELLPVSGARFDFVCVRENIASGRTQRIVRFCQRGLAAKQAEKAVSDFKCFVVTGR